ncbi:hypothetical protein [Micromonospora sp. CA-246542]|uniref:hypothetical protein n=1 Tax=Micromonospora sp. CA-246542 TaxID=3239959 RepID=UPI003D8EB52E
MDKREFLWSLIGRETVSTAAKKAGGAVEDLGKDMKATAHDAARLDKEIAGAENGLKDLAVQFARTSDAAERMDISKAMRKQQSELHKLTKAKSFIEEGSEAASGFAASFVGRIGPLVAKAPLGPAGAVLGAGLAAAALPTIAAGIAGAVVGGVGLGGVIGGLALAGKDSRVQAAGRDLKDAVLGDLEEFSSVFVGPAVQGIGIIRGAWAEVTDEVEDSFGSAAKYVTPLARGVAGLLREVAPGVRDAMQSAGPVIREISAGLPRVGRALSEMFSTFADNADEGASAIRYLFMVVEGGIGAVTTTVDVFSSLYRTLLDIGEAGGAVADTLWGWLPVLGGKVDEGRAKIAELKGALNDTSGFDSTTTGAKNLTDQQIILNSSMRDGISAAGGLSAAFDQLNGKALSSREAESNYQAAIDNVTASIKENGKTLDLNTEKGRANDQAIRNLISSVDAKAQAVYDETEATQGQAAAEAAAARVYETGRQQLIKNLVQLGLTKNGAQALADQIMKIPKSWNTTISASTAAATKILETFQKRVNGLTGKTVTVQVKTNGDHRIVGVGTQIRGAASGGPITGSGPKGKDSVPMMLAPGEHVLTAREVDAAGGHGAIESLRAGLRNGRPMTGARSSGGSAPAATGGIVIQTLVVQANSPAELVEQLQKEARRVGGVKNLFGG